MSDNDRGKPVCPHCGTTALYTVTPRGDSDRDPYHVCPGGHSWRTADWFRLPPAAARYKGRS